MSDVPTPSPKGTSAFSKPPLSGGAVSVGESLWSRAQTKAVPSVKFSLSFHTLRDMIQDAEINPNRLKRVQRLGEGSFAVVDKCVYETDDGMQRMVAVKRLKTQVFKEALDLQDFVKEALLLRRLSHAHVVDFIGLGAGVEKAQETGNDVSQEHVFLVTEFMTKGTLYSKVVGQMKAARQVYTVQEGLQWLIHVAKGLKYLHNANPCVIHRDLKLENVLLTSNGSHQTVAKIGDFGLHALVPPISGETRQIGTKKVVRITSKRFLEQIRTIKSGEHKYGDALFRLSGRTGSLMYMAPEVLQSSPYNEKADVYSFAILMYEVLQKCLLIAFVSLRGVPAEVEQYIQSVLSGFRPYLPPSWPKELRDLFRLCWADQISSRPSMERVVEVLEDILKRELLQEEKETFQKGRCHCCRIQ